jgi:tetratricopeptide (TPR) repeat protein
MHPLGNVPRSHRKITAGRYFHKIRPLDALQWYGASLLESRPTTVEAHPFILGTAVSSPTFIIPLAFWEIAAAFTGTLWRPDRNIIFDRTSLHDIVSSIMKMIAAVVLSCLFLLGRQTAFGDSAEQRYDLAMDKLAKAATEEKRFYALDAAAKTNFEIGKIDEARKYADELQTLLPKFKGDWNYGNAIQDTNLVTGRIALSEGRTDDAKRSLIEAGKSPGSPQMDTFGPNMSLAKDMLEKGERETVLQYFDLCRKFWRMDRGRLDAWRDEVNAGRIPDFGANLLY